MGTERAPVHVPETGLRRDETELDALRTQLDVATAALSVNPTDPGLQTLHSMARERYEKLVGEGPALGS